MLIYQQVDAVSKEWKAIPKSVGSKSKHWTSSDASCPDEEFVCQ